VSPGTLLCPGFSRVRVTLFILDREPERPLLFHLKICSRRVKQDAPILARSSPPRAPTSARINPQAPLGSVSGAWVYLGAPVLPWGDCYFGRCSVLTRGIGLPSSSTKLVTNASLTPALTLAPPARVTPPARRGACTGLWLGLPPALVGDRGTLGSCSAVWVDTCFTHDHWTA